MYIKKKIKNDWKYYICIQITPDDIMSGVIGAKNMKIYNSLLFLKFNTEKKPVQDWSQCSSYIFISLISGVETRVHVTEKDNLVSWHF